MQTVKCRWGSAKTEGRRQQALPSLEYTHQPWSSPREEGLRSKCQHAAACRAATHASCCSAWLLRLTRRTRAEHRTRGNDEPTTSGARAATVDAGRVVDRPSKSIVRIRPLCDAATLNDATHDAPRDARRRTPPTTYVRSTCSQTEGLSPLCLFYSKIPNL